MVYYFLRDLFSLLLFLIQYLLKKQSLLKHRTIQLKEALTIKIVYMHMKIFKGINCYKLYTIVTKEKNLTYILPDKILKFEFAFSNKTANRKHLKTSKNNKFKRNRFFKTLTYFIFF